MTADRARPALRWRTVEGPAGAMRLAEDDEGLVEVRFVDDARMPSSSGGRPRFLDDAEAQLREYFAGRRRAFDVPLSMAGTAFERRVWAALSEIPYGETRSYADVARAVGKPGAARAVGMANHRNPICILIPCHRVIGADGRLVGYGGGLERKRFLLALEAANRGAERT